MLPVPTMSEKGGGDPAMVRRAQWWLSGKNRHNRNFKPGALDGHFGPQMGRACQRAKWYLGYAKADISPQYGAGLHSFLVPKGNPHAVPLPAAYKLRKAARAGRPNPYAESRFPAGRPWPFTSRATGRLIGCPYQGTHTLGNWESDNAVDLGVPVGTPVIAIWDGTIGSRIGALDSSDPHMLGLRLHLTDAHGRDSYYAHLSQLRVHAGQHVRRGDVLGLSGSANGVAHLHISVQPPGRPDDLFGIDGC